MIHEEIEHHIVPRRYVGPPNRLRIIVGQDEGYAFPPVAPTAPNGVSKTAGALIAAG